MYIKKLFNCIHKSDDGTICLSDIFLTIVTLYNTIFQCFFHITSSVTGWTRCLKQTWKCTYTLI